MNGIGPCPLCCHLTHIYGSLVSHLSSRHSKRIPFSSVQWHGSGRRGPCVLCAQKYLEFAAKILFRLLDPVPGAAVVTVTIIRAIDPRFGVSTHREQQLADHETTGRQGNMESGSCSGEMRRLAGRGTGLHCRNGSDNKDGEAL